MASRLLQLSRFRCYALNERPSQVNAYKDHNQPAYQVFFSR